MAGALVGVGCNSSFVLRGADGEGVEAGGSKHAQEGHDEKPEPEEAAQAVACGAEGVGAVVQ